MANLGYDQCVTEYTTENGTPIDYVYNKVATKIHYITKVILVYFSTHENSVYIYTNITVIPSTVFSLISSKHLLYRMPLSTYQTTVRPCG